MFSIIPADNTIWMYQQALINETTQIQTDNLHYYQETRNLIETKNMANVTSTLRKTMMQQVQAAYYHKIYKKQFIATNVSVPTKLSAYYTSQGYNYPIAMNDCNAYMTTILPQTFNYAPESPKEEVMTTSQTTSINADVSNASNNQTVQNDSLEFYLQLPKELFPAPRMLPLDPNPLIDEFCKMSQFHRYRHMPWLLDLELGIPKSPITRPIPAYNVKFNSINCKNTPDAIHPGFESCNPDFKKALLFYHDCVVSAWYRGYVIMYGDISVDNFQSWLSQPMEVLGMGWA